MDSIYIPDPIEISNRKIDRLEDMFIDDHTCMICKKRVEYELVCVSPIGDGPAVCEECYGHIIEL